MIKETVSGIRLRIIGACSKIDRDPSKIIIVAVSKTRTTQVIKEVTEAGITDIGENRVQEAFAKYNELRTMNYELGTIKWHMVGHLQTNKAKDAVKIFDLIQSVDSLHLAQEIDKQASKINKIQDILIEVNTSGETTKYGVKPEELTVLINSVSELNNVRVKGLMTVAPVVDEPEKARPYFRILRELKDKINGLSTMNHELITLSMGMTDDFEVAIEEGSNMVRLGRALFEG